LFLLNCNLINDFVSNSDFVALNRRMVNKHRLKECGREFFFQNLRFCHDFDLKDWGYPQKHLK
jgi:hypothetical protein